LLYHQAGGNGHGPRDQPLHHRGARRPPVGGTERWARRDVPVQLAGSRRRSFGLTIAPPWASLAPSGSELRTGRAEVAEGPDLDGAQRGEGDTRSDPHRLAEIACLDHGNAAERLLGLHERTVGRRYLAVADLHGRGRRGELESDGRHQVTAGLQLAVVGPDGAEN